jgi:hypothetical protein
MAAAKITVDEIISIAEHIRTVMSDANTFFDSYDNVVNTVIPDLNDKLEQYISSKIAFAKETVIDNVMRAIDWDDMKLALVSSVNSKRPVNTTGLFWVDINNVSDNDIDSFDDSDIICMYDNYDESSLKIFVRHRKALNRYIDNFVNDIRAFENNVNAWIGRTTKVMVECNVKCLTENHYANVISSLNQQKLAKKQAGKSKSSKGSKVQTQTQKQAFIQQPATVDEPKIITLNGVEVQVLKSQSEFIKYAVKHIIESM